MTAEADEVLAAQTYSMWVGCQLCGVDVMQIATMPDGSAIVAIGHAPTCGMVAAHLVVTGEPAACLVDIEAHADLGAVELWLGHKVTVEDVLGPAGTIPAHAGALNVAKAAKHMREAAVR